MLRERGSSGNRFAVVILLLPFFLASCKMKESSSQETPPDTEAGQEGITEAEVGEQEATEAEVALAAALSEAEKDGRRVFLHTGADW